MLKIDRYQASLFAPGVGVEPSPATIGALMQVPSLNQFMPSVVTMLNIEQNAREATQPRLGLRLMSSDQIWTVDFEDNRILLTYRPALKEDPIEFSSFVDTGINYLQAIANCLKVSGNRLALVRSEFLPPLPDQEMNGAFSKFVRPIEFYNPSAVREWLVRCVGRQSISLNGAEEESNIVTDLDRVHLIIKSPEKPQESERLRLTIDINTIQSNNITRFNPDSIKEFFLAALDITAQLKSQVEARFA